ncbi:MAG: V-type ATP synthase subunit E [Candidatus Bipolaricaulota bacterium]|nr:V-type ATP synthase subunit E [Candidatus Bipolaricaulota bacterium]
MSAEKIVEKILSDARAEAQRVVENARAQAVQIREQAEREAQQQRELILAQARQEAQSRRRAQLAAATAAARNAVLEAKRALLESVFEQAAAKLAAMPAHEYKNWLLRLIVHAVETGEEEVVLSAADKQALGEALIAEANAQLAQHGKKGALRLSAETREIGRGFVLKGTHSETNVTMATLMRRAKDELEIEVAQMLFGEARK